MIYIYIDTCYFVSEGNDDGDFQRLVNMIYGNIHQEFKSLFEAVNDGYAKLLYTDILISELKGCIDRANNNLKKGDPCKFYKDICSKGEDFIQNIKSNGLHIDNLAQSNHDILDIINRKYSNPKKPPFQGKEQEFQDAITANILSNFITKMDNDILYFITRDKSFCERMLEIKDNKLQVYLNSMGSVLKDIHDNKLEEFKEKAKNTLSMNLKRIEADIAKDVHNDAIHKEIENIVLSYFKYDAREGYSELSGEYEEIEECTIENLVLAQEYYEDIKKSTFSAILTFDAIINCYFGYTNYDGAPYCSKEGGYFMGGDYYKGESVINCEIVVVVNFTNDEYSIETIEVQNADTVNLQHSLYEDWLGYVEKGECVKQE